jgi:hypothetical protein
VGNRQRPADWGIPHSKFQIFYLTFPKGVLNMKIYKDQTALRITVRTFTDLRAVDKVGIKYRKPDGSSGEFTAGVADAVKGVFDLRPWPENH